MSQDINNKINDSFSDTTTEVLTEQLSSTESDQSVYSTLSDLDAELTALTIQEIQETVMQYEYQIAIEEYSIFEELD